MNRRVKHKIVLTPSSRSLTFWSLSPERSLGCRLVLAPRGLGLRLGTERSLTFWDCWFMKLSSCFISSFFIYGLLELIH